MKRTNRLLTAACAAALAVMLALTLYLDVFCAKHVLDGDMSASLVRAHEIYTQRRLIPQGYAFTSEMRLLDMPLLFSFFFHFTADWTVVRVLGTVTAQALLLLAFVYLLRCAGVGRRLRLIGAALCLMPFSAAYARIMLYHAHYTLYMAQCCLMLALTLRLCEGGGKPAARVIRAAALGVLWLACGLNGVKHLMLLALPLGLCAAKLLCDDLREPELSLTRKTDSVRLLCWLLFGLCCFLPGFLLNTRVITPMLSVQAQQTTAFGGSIAEGRVLRLVNNLLHAMGVRVTKHSLIGPRGVSLVCALVLFGGAWRLSATRTRDVPKPEPIAARVLTRLPLTALLGTIALLLLVDGHEPEEWYFVVPLAYALPLLLITLQEGVSRPEAPPLRRVIAGICVVCLCFQGAYTALFIHSRGDSRADTWTGLPLHSMKVVEELTPVAEALLESGDTRCLTLYWYASPLTEMTNGRVQAGAYFWEDGVLGLHDYGSDLRPYQGENLPDRVPILIPREDAERLQKEFPSSQYRFTGGSFELWDLYTAEAQLDRLLR